MKKNEEPKEHSHEQPETKTLAAGNQLYICGMLTPTSIAEIMVGFRQATASNEAVDIFISSGGGWVEGAFGIYDLIKSVPNKIRTFGIGSVGSAANLILVAGDERYMYKTCKMYLHDGSIALSGEMSEAAMRSLSKEMGDVEALYNTYMAKNSKLTAENYKTLCANETYLSANQCAKFGIVDYVIQDYPKKKKKGKK